MANSKFWLSPRKDYIFENFDALATYLRDCTYDFDSQNADFDDTLRCMTELADDITHTLSDSPFYAEPDLDGHTPDEVLRLLMATILACNKSRRPVYKPLAQLCVVICRCSTNIAYDTLVKFFNIITACIRRQEIASLPFNWTDLTSPTVNVPILALKVEKTMFSVEKVDSVRILETKGAVIIPEEGTPKIFNGTYAAFRKIKHPYDTFSLPDILSVVAEADSKTKTMDFTEEYEFTTRLLRSMTPLKRKTNVEVEKNDYTMDDEFIVRIVLKRNAMVVGETIDAKYNKIRGKIDLNLGDNRPAFRIVNNQINEGDYLRVMKADQGDFTFELLDSFEYFYREFAADFYNQTQSAIFMRDYGKGSQWLTEYGVRVGIDHAAQRDRLSEEERKVFNSCIAGKNPMRVQFYSNRPNTEQENFNMYAMPLLDEWSMRNTTPVDPEQVDTELFLEFMDNCTEEAEKIIKANKLIQSILALNVEDCAHFLPVLYRICSSTVLSTKERLEYLTALAMLCDMCGRTLEFEYIDHDRRFLNAEVQFITNRPVETLTHPMALQEVESIYTKEKTINTLKNYRPDKKTNTLDIESTFVNDKEVYDKVSALVQASNNLSGIIDDIEQNNIKQIIAKTLNVDDEFVSTLSERTFYGMENISLEFKSSIACPPKNRRRIQTMEVDPEVQKWAVLIAINGFLNSRNGGELLLGVNDSGYAIGVQDDINKLYNHNYIKFPTLDDYKNFVNSILDFAFRTSKRSNIPSKTIARDCIEVAEEENDEGLFILRIKVHPYPGDIVCFAAKDSERPSGLEDAYLRQSGRTIPMTANMREQVMRYKS